MPLGHVKDLVRLNVSEKEKSEVLRLKLTLCRMLPIEEKLSKYIVVNIQHMKNLFNPMRL